MKCYRLDYYLSGIGKLDSALSARGVPSALTSSLSQSPQPEMVKARTKPVAVAPWYRIGRVEPYEVYFQGRTLVYDYLLESARRGRWQELECYPNPRGKHYLQRLAAHARVVGFDTRYLSRADEIPLHRLWVAGPSRPSG